MPWIQTEPEMERRKLVQAALRREESMKVLCQRFGISLGRWRRAARTRRSVAGSYSGDCANGFGFRSGFGIHRFVIGDTTGGILHIVISIVTCGIGSLIGFIEGIIYLTKTDEQFIKEYQVGKKAWF